MANGSADKIPSGPFGSQTDRPSSGSRFSAHDRSKCGAAATQNTSNTPSASAVISTVNRKVISTPTTLRPTNAAYAASHQRGSAPGGVPKIAPRYPPMPTTMTAGVNTYSIFSASPVMYAPQGPIAERAKEYAPPVCGSAAAISAMLKQSPAYITVMIVVAARSPPKPPAARPKFHPKKSPEITAPTPSAQRDHTPAYRRRPRSLKYSSATRTYSTPWPFFVMARSVAVWRDWR